MRIEIDLVANIAHVKDSNIVLDECQRNNERRKPAMIIADHGQQLGFFVGAERSLKCSIMCWSTFTCLRTVAFTASVFMNSSPYRWASSFGRYW